MRYGSVKLGPLIFQDDVLHAVQGIKEARSSNQKIDRVVKTLNLTLNEDKTFCTVIGSKKQITQVRAELKKEPGGVGSGNS